jgi:hypothetical protein
VAVAKDGGRGEVREYGSGREPTAAALDRLLSKLGSAGMRLRFCYEMRPVIVCTPLC